MMKSRNTKDNDYGVRKKRKKSTRMRNKGYFFFPKRRISEFQKLIIIFYDKY